MSCEIYAVECIALQMRRDIITMTTEAGSGHPGGSLSAVDLLATLFFYDTLRYRAEDPLWSGRDRFILSKGHAAPTLYAALAQAGYFDRSELITLRKLGSRLQGHPDSRKLSGVEVSTGSLGQGLSIAAGLAYALLFEHSENKEQHKQDEGLKQPKQPKQPKQEDLLASAEEMPVSCPQTAPTVYVLLGDGELQEGQNWEAAMFAAQKRLSNLVAIVDYNGLQIDGSLNDIVSLDNLAEKFAAFGFKTIEIDGHSISQIKQAYTQAAAFTEGPVVIIAHTIKGKGVSFMENQAGWHGKAATFEQAKQALVELVLSETPAATPQPREAVRPMTVPPAAATTAAVPTSIGQPLSPHTLSEDTTGERA